MADQWPTIPGGRNTGPVAKPGGPTPPPPGTVIIANVDEDLGDGVYSLSWGSNRISVTSRTELTPGQSLILKSETAPDGKRTLVVQGPALPEKNFGSGRALYGPRTQAAAVPAGASAAVETIDLTRTNSDRAAAALAAAPPAMTAPRGAAQLLGLTLEPVGEFQASVDILMEEAAREREKTAADAGKIAAGDAAPDKSLSREGEAGRTRPDADMRPMPPPATGSQKSPDSPPVPPAAIPGASADTARPAPPPPGESGTPPATGEKTQQPATSESRSPATSISSGGMETEPTSSTPPASGSIPAQKGPEIPADAAHSTPPSPGGGGTPAAAGVSQSPVMDGTQTSAAGTPSAGVEARPVPATPPASDPIPPPVSSPAIPEESVAAARPAPPASSGGGTPTPGGTQAPAAGTASAGLEARPVPATPPGSGSVPVQKNPEISADAAHSAPPSPGGGGTPAAGGTQAPAAETPSAGVEAVRPMPSTPPASGAAPSPTLPEMPADASPRAAPDVFVKEALTQILKAAELPLASPSADSQALGVSRGRVPDAIADKAAGILLRAAGLTPSPQSLEAARALLENNVPVDRQAVRAILDVAAGAEGEERIAVVKAAARLAARDIPLSPPLANGLADVMARREGVTELAARASAALADGGMPPAARPLLNTAREMLDMLAVDLDAADAPQALERYVSTFGREALGKALALVERAAQAVLENHPVLPKIDQALTGILTTLEDAIAAMEEGSDASAPAASGTPAAGAASRPAPPPEAAPSPPPPPPPASPGETPAAPSGQAPSPSTAPAVSGSPAASPAPGPQPAPLETPESSAPPPASPPTETAAPPKRPSTQIYAGANSPINAYLRTARPIPDLASMNLPPMPKVATLEGQPADETPPPAPIPQGGGQANAAGQPAPAAQPGASGGIQGENVSAPPLPQQLVSPAPLVPPLTEDAPDLPIPPPASAAGGAPPPQSPPQPIPQAAPQPQPAGMIPASPSPDPASAGDVRPAPPFPAPAAPNRVDAPTAADPSPRPGAAASPETEPVRRPAARPGVPDAARMTPEQSSAAPRQGGGELGHAKEAVLNASMRLAGASAEGSLMNRLPTLFQTPGLNRPELELLKPAGFLEQYLASGGGEGEAGEKTRAEAGTVMRNLLSDDPEQAARERRELPARDHEVLREAAGRLSRMESDIVKADSALGRLSDAAASLRDLGRQILAVKAENLAGQDRLPGVMLAEVPFKLANDAGNGRMQMFSRKSKGKGDGWSSRIILDLNTTGMGPVLGDMRFFGQDMTLNLFVERRETADFLAGAADDLLRDLRDKGFRLKARFLVLPPPPRIQAERPEMAGEDVPGTEIPPVAAPDGGKRGRLDTKA